MLSEKKILYITKDKHPFDIRTEKITESFREIGCQTAILCRVFEGEGSDYYKGIRIFHLGKFSSKLSLPVPYNPFWRSSIKNAVKVFKPDLIIVREIMLAIDVAQIAKKNNIPVVMDMAENYPVVMRGWNKYKKNFLVRWLVHDLRLPDKIEKKSVLMMDAILTVCEEQNKRLAGAYNYNESKLHIVHNTPKKIWFHDVKRGMLIKPKVFAYHGLINSERNLEKLIYAFDMAWHVRNDIQLIIAGYGELEEHLKSIASKLDSSQNIVFRGKFEHGQIKNLYSEMDFGILPYRIDEHINQTISNKYFDYMGAGKPMITSLADPMIRLNHETHCGVAIDCENIDLIADTIIQFVSDSNYERLVEMSESALLAFKCHYSWDRDFERLVRFLGRLLNVAEPDEFTYLSE